MVPLARRAVAALGEHFERVKICGSLRRGEQWVGDIDAVVAGRKPGSEGRTITEMLMAQFPGIVEIKTTAPRRRWLLADGQPKIDVWEVPLDRLGATVLYATGCGEFNVIMHRWAHSRGLCLTSQGLFTLKEERLVAAESEREVFRQLGWEPIPPTKRSDFLAACAPYLEVMNRG